MIAVQIGVQRNVIAQCISRCALKAPFARNLLCRAVLELHSLIHRLIVRQCQRRSTPIGLKQVRAGHIRLFDRSEAPDRRDDEQA